MVDDPLAAHPARLIGVGGGPGAYAAIWARRGYDVHLYDCDQMLLAARAVESEPTLSGLSSHLLAVGTKPGAVQPG